jgi:hypothetical protein
MTSMKKDTNSKSLFGFENTYDKFLRNIIEHLQTCSFLHFTYFIDCYYLTGIGSGTKSQRKSYRFLVVYNHETNLQYLPQ